jgi:histidinol-phosphate aminotransferase
MAKLTRIVDALPATVPFVGPEAQERARGRSFAARIGANENVFGPSPKAIAAMQAEAPHAWKYGDPENHDLRHAIAAHHGVKAENVMLGEGIDGLLGTALRLLIEPGDKVVTSLGGYPTFNFHVAALGGELVTVPYAGDHEDGLALAARAGQVGAKVFYFANPDNPMGSWHNAEYVGRVIASVPPDAVLFLDEAYGEFAPQGTLPPMCVENPNVLRFRTFSKAYGLAGMRVGYCLGHKDLIAAFDRVRNHFGVGRVAQAGALAALQDQEWLGQVVERVNASKSRIAEIARENGFTPLPGATNFVAIDCGKDGAYAKSVLDRLIEHDVFIRMPGLAPLNRCIRVSAGRGADMDSLATALKTSSFRP